MIIWTRHIHTLGSRLGPIVCGFHWAHSCRLSGYHLFAPPNLCQSWAHFLKHCGDSCPIYSVQYFFSHSSIMKINFLHLRNEILFCYFWFTLKRYALRFPEILLFFDLYVELYAIEKRIPHKIQLYLKNVANKTHIFLNKRRYIFLSFKKNKGTWIKLNYVTGK